MSQCHGRGTDVFPAERGLCKKGIRRYGLTFVNINLLVSACRWWFGSRAFEIQLIRSSSDPFPCNKTQGTSSNLKKVAFKTTVDGRNHAPFGMYKKTL